MQFADSDVKPKFNSQLVESSDVMHPIQPQYG